jgi:hypothetical protein
MAGHPPSKATNARHRLPRSANPSSKAAADAQGCHRHAESPPPRAAPPPPLVVDPPGVGGGSGPGTPKPRPLHWRRHQNSGVARGAPLSRIVDPARGQPDPAAGVPDSSPRRRRQGRRGNAAQLHRPRCATVERDAPPPPSLGPARVPAGPSSGNREGRTKTRAARAGARSRRPSRPRRGQLEPEGGNFYYIYFAYRK